MKTKIRKVLPKIAYEISNGGVYLQRIRCGKSNCKCAHGATHTAHYFFTRRNGKLVKIYVPKRYVESFSKLVKSAASNRRRNRTAAKQSNELLAHLRQSIRQYEKTAPRGLQRYE